MNFKLLHPRDQIERVMARVYSREMTTTSGGNISVRDASGEVWITPARVDKGRLRRSDMVLLGPDGEKLDGPFPPSSEYPFHLGIYRERPDIGAVIHAHPGALVSFSISGKVPDTRIFPEAWNICGKVAFAPYALPGSRQLGKNIAAEFARSRDIHCVILQNHGVVVGGADLEEAFKRFETLELTAETEIQARRMGKVRSLSDEQLELANRGRASLVSCPEEDPGNRERELRKEICDFMHRAYSHRLVTSTWGSLSARIDGDAFLITPYGVDRDLLELADPVVICSGKCPEGRIPSRALRIHQAIYDAHPEIQSVINALPVHATAFSIGNEKLDTRTIPESYLFLKDVPRIPFEVVLNQPEMVSKSVGQDNPVALLDHNGALVAGESVLDAFDRLEVLESTAKAIIQSSPLGPIQPMDDSVIKELMEEFGQV